MLTTKKWAFSEGQDIASTAISTNVYTNGPTQGTNTVDLGSGNPLFGVITVGEQVAAAGSATVNFQLVTATDNALTTSVRVHWESGAIDKATLAPGYQIKFRLPIEGGTAGAYQKFIGINYVVASGPLTGTGGQFQAVITAGHPPVKPAPFESGQTWHS